MIRLGVLASGGGTNLQAILDACAAGRIDARVAVVLSNVPGAGALARAEQEAVQGCAYGLHAASAVDPDTGHAPEGEAL